MTVIVCASKNGAVMFNNRRCSKDKTVISDILSCYKHQSICVSEYSSTLFDNVDIKIVSDISDLTSDDILFLEDFSFEEALEKADILIIYRWDRIYPADRIIEIGENFKKISSVELVGFSHPLITKEVYRNETQN